MQRRLPDRILEQLHIHRVHVEAHRERHRVPQRAVHRDGGSDLDLDRARGLAQPVADEWRAGRAETGAGRQRVADGRRGPGRHIERALQRGRPHRCGRQRPQLAMAAGDVGGQHHQRRHRHMRAGLLEQLLRHAAALQQLVALGPRLAKGADQRPRIAHRHRRAKGIRFRSRHGLGDLPAAVRCDGLVKQAWRKMPRNWPVVNWRRGLPWRHPLDKRQRPTRKATLEECDDLHGHQCRWRNHHLP